MKLVMAAALLMTVSLAAQPATEGQEVTPAQQRIAWAQKRIRKDPKSPQGYNELAMALAKRARETSDASYYAQAEEAIEKSLALAPDNFEAGKVRAWVRLGKHEFAAALAEAKALSRRAPDDVTVYGFLVDAHVHLGNYKEAEEAAQWMLDLRPGNVPGLTRAAHLRELFGDVDGALELMQMACAQIPPGETEDRAWILTQMGRLHLSVGRVKEAAPILEQALKLFPGYHYALAALAEARAAESRHEDAIELLRQRYRAAPHPENLFELAVALDRAGKKQEARAAFAQFEREARAEIEGVDNANRELIVYYTDYAPKPAEALRIAQKEIARRRDVFTLDAYAWALYANGRYAEARKQLEAALAVGIRDARLFYHAGVIAKRGGDRAAAARYFRASLDTNSASAVAAETRAALEALGTERRALR